MKSVTYAFLAAGALVLSACGGGHASCKDEASATAYAQKWATDLQAAVASGKLDAAKAAEAGQELMAMGADIGNDFAKGCAKLDEIRSKLGF